MISHIRNVLERQRLSEEMDRGSQIYEKMCNKIVEFLKKKKNNVPQCQIAKTLQISSSADSEKLSVKHKSKDLYWMSVVFRTSEDTA